VQWLFELMEVLADNASTPCYAEPMRRSIRCIRTVKGRTSKFGWLQAPQPICDRQGRNQGFRPFYLPGVVNPKIGSEHPKTQAQTPGT
jgi:hypothetical protein